MTDQIELQISDSVANIRLNNPDQHNALTKIGMEQFQDHLASIEQTSSIRVVTISGAGDKTFCSGAALKEINAGIITSNTFQSLADRLATLPVPKIAAINGSVYGGGVEIGLCCDFRIGTPGMKLMVPAAKFGLCYPLNGIQRFVSSLGPGAAKRILVSAESLGAQELLNIGYLHRLAEPENLQSQVKSWAAQIAQLAPLAVAAMLRICNQTADGTLDRVDAQRWIDQCNQSDDLKVGLQAAVDKLKPLFSGT